MSTKKVTQTIQPGDWVLLIGRDRKSFIIQLKPSQQFQTHYGTIAHDDLIGAPWGGQASTQLNYPLASLRPSTDELVHNLKHTNQWDYLPHVRAAPVNGGFFGSILPAANQVSHLPDPLEKPNFGLTEVEELMFPFYKTVPRHFRPQNRLLIQTYETQKSLGTPWGC